MGGTVSNDAPQDEPVPPEVVVMLTHGTEEPSFVLHALRMAVTATAFGHTVGLIA
jgi:hypothetical protein